MSFTNGEIRAALDAMWDNAIDSLRADRRGVSFDEIDRENEIVFRRWLGRREGLRARLIPDVPLHP